MESGLLFVATGLRAKFMQIRLSEETVKRIEKHIELKKKLDPSYSSSKTSVANFWLAVGLSNEEDRMTEKLNKKQKC